MRREVAVLVGSVLAVDAGFISGYFAAGLQRVSPAGKLAYLVLWTGVTLLLVLRGLLRIRAARARTNRSD